MVLITDPVLKKMYEQTLSRFKGTFYDAVKGDSFTVPFGQSIVRVKRFEKLVKEQPGVAMTIPGGLVARLDPVRHIEDNTYLWEPYEELSVTLTRMDDKYLVYIDVSNANACNLVAWILNLCQDVSPSD